MPCSPTPSKDSIYQILGWSETNKPEWSIRNSYTVGNGFASPPCFNPKDRREGDIKKYYIIIN